MTLNDDIKQVHGEITELQKMQQTQFATLAEYLVNLDTVVAEAQNKYEQLQNTIADLNKEHETLERTKLNLEDSIKENTNIMNTLEPELKTAEERIQNLVTANEKLTSTNTGLSADIAQKQQEIIDAKADLQTKKETLARMKKDIAEKSETINQKLEEAESKLALVKGKYPATSFMFARGLEAAPKAEILTIIAANRPISNDQIKKGVKSVSPVQVQRFITMLEADEKIILNDEDKWDLAPDFLAKL